MNKKARGQLLGMILGDGHIEKTGNSYRIRITHGPKQRRYLQHKASLLESILKKPVVVREGSLSRGQYRQFYAQVTHDVFRDLHAEVYRLDKTTQRYRKRYTRDLLEGLTPEGVALWYLDDGCLARSHRSKYAGQLTLSTYVSKKQNEVISDYFRETWGIGFGVFASGRSYRMVCSGREETRKFIEIVEPWVLPSMAYKTNSQLKNPSRK